MSERKLIQQTIIDHMRSQDPSKQRRALDALTDFIRVKAREEGWKLPVKNCPVAPDEKVLYTIDGIPFYESDLRTDADTREILGRRLKLHGEKGSTEPRIDDVFMHASMVKMDDVLERLSNVGPWECVRGDITPRADSTTTYKLKSQYASRDFYADVTLSDDRRHITVEFR